MKTLAASALQCGQTYVASMRRRPTHHHWASLLPSFLLVWAILPGCTPPTDFSWSDQDGDGFVVCAPAESCAPIAGLQQDCDDSSSSIYPGAQEQCNELDDNCDGEDDTELKHTYYADGDSDTYGDPNSHVQACETPPGYVSDNSDCNDNCVACNDKADEICDELDNDCNGEVDEAGAVGIYYHDVDQDGYGDPPTQYSLITCTTPPGDTNLGGDCNDQDATINPSASEICDGQDNNCDGDIDGEDQDDLESEVDYYNDDDRDGHGDELDTDPERGCAGEEHDDHAPNNDDCDDSNSATYPAATEICDQKDNDCNGTVPTNEADTDNDDYLVCENDCVDNDSNINPGKSEQCNGLDDNCDDAIPNTGTSSESDGDVDNYMVCEGDCDDRSKGIYPGAKEVCDDSDNDCDGKTDTYDPDLETTTYYYDDADDDGHGDKNDSSPEKGCPQQALPDGKTTNNDDCDDGDASIYGGASEVCDGKDNDCDGAVATEESDVDTDKYLACAGCEDLELAEGFAGCEDCNDFFDDVYPGAPDICADGLKNDCNDLTSDDLDTDSDGYFGCEECNDANDAINPAATEICDGVDNNCDGKYVEGETSDSDQDGSLDCADCVDTDAMVYPGASEVCDGKDNDCDGSKLSDEKDTDVDKYLACSGCPTSLASGYLGCNDCDDTLPTDYPGATEIVGNAVDESCDGKEECYVDADKDGYTLTATSTVDESADTDLTCETVNGEAAGVSTSLDCDDDSNEDHPTATETVGNGDDEDCDGKEKCYVDADKDGYTLSSSTTVEESLDTDINCEKSDGEASSVSGTLDCNDSSNVMYPTATEVCDGLDNDCDGTRDDGNSLEHPYTVLIDDDKDGYGAYASLCLLPFGLSTVSVRGDCADADSGRYPGAADTANDGKDQDCGGTINADPHVGFSTSIYTKIQDAVNAYSSSAQTIYVKANTYTESDLDFGTKSVKLYSTHFAANTIIQAISSKPTASTTTTKRVFVFDSTDTGTVEVDGFTIRYGNVYNSSDDVYGGAISISGASPTFRNCIIADSVATGKAGRGGGVAVQAGSTTPHPKFYTCIFSGNTADLGGAFYLGNSANVTVTIEGCLFTTNAATDLGGALYRLLQPTANTGATLNLSNSRIEANDATNGGGGLYLGNGKGDLHNLLIRNNSAPRGGGMYIKGDAATTYSTLLLTQNEATAGEGSGLLIEDASVTLDHLVVVGNTGTSGTCGATTSVIAGVYLAKPTATTSDITFTNSAFSYNTGYNIVNSPCAALTLTGSSPLDSVSISYSNMYQSSGMTGNIYGLSGNGYVTSYNISQEPGFLEYAEYTLYSTTVDIPFNFHLNTGSPLIDKGSDGGDIGAYGGTYADVWDLDQDGYYDYWWPGYCDDAPSSEVADEWDADDLDPAVYGCP